MERSTLRSEAKEGPPPTRRVRRPRRRQESTVDHVHFPAQVDAPTGFKFRLAVESDESLHLWAENKTRRTQFEAALADGECRALIDSRAITTPAFHSMLTHALGLHTPADEGLDKPGDEGLSVAAEVSPQSMTLTLTFSPNQWATQTFTLALAARPTDKIDVLAAQMHDLLPWKPEVAKWTSDALGDTVSSAVPEHGLTSMPVQWTPQQASTPGLFATDGGQFTIHRPGLYRVEACLFTTSASQNLIASLMRGEEEVARAGGFHNQWSGGCHLTDLIPVKAGQHIEIVLSSSGALSLGGLGTRLLITRMCDL